MAPDKEIAFNRWEFAIYPQIRCEKSKNMKVLTLESSFSLCCFNSWRSLSTFSNFARSASSSSCKQKICQIKPQTIIIWKPTSWLFLLHHFLLITFSPVRFSKKKKSNVVEMQIDFSAIISVIGN